MGRFIFLCVSFTWYNLREGRDLIGLFSAILPGPWGVAQNLVVLTDMCGMEDGRTVSRLPK